MTADSIVKLCTSDETVTKELAKDPTKEIDKIVDALVKTWKQTEKAEKKDKGSGDAAKDEKERLDRAANCGKFPYRPSDLFLKVSFPSLKHALSFINY